MQHRRAARLYSHVGTLFALVFLAGCMHPTPYVAATAGEGYSEQKVENDRYRVRFAGNAATSRETVENYLLYRAAEVTLESGQDWFRIVDQNVIADTAYRTSGTVFPSPVIRPYRYSFRTFDPVFVSANSRPITQFEAAAVISMHTGERPPDDDQAYDALTVINVLGPVIVRPEATNGG